MPLKFNLDNGLGVILWEDKKSPVISAQVWVKNGSIDEGRGQEGLSHFIEHLLFKGTEKYRVGEIAQLVEGSGGELNAYTSFDHTVYYVNISSAFSDVALDVLAEMVGHPTFDISEVDNERGVVIEEIKRSLDNPSRQASRLLFENSYRKHPYRRPVLGYDRVIEKVPTSKIVDFFKSRYVPSNMTLVVAGDFSNSEMKKKIKKVFGNLAEGKRPSRRARHGELEQTRARLKVRKTKFPEDMVFVSWKIPGIRHRDIPAIDVLSLILGQGETSRLYKELRIRNSFVKSIGCSTYVPEDLGIFSLYLSLNREHIVEALDKTIEVMFDFLSNGPTSEEMDKAILQMVGGEVYSYETAEGLANRVGWGELYHGDPEYLKKHLDEIAQVKSRDVLRVAKKYLKPEQMSLSCLAHEGPPDYTKDLRRFLRKYAQKFSELKASRATTEGREDKLRSRLDLKIRPTKKTEIKDVTLKNGARVLYVHNPAIPIYTLKAGFRGGMRAEHHQGASEMMGRLWSSGGGDFSEEEIHQATESRSSSLSAFAGRNTNGLTMGGLSPFFKELWPYFESSLVSPTFSQSVFEREKFQVGAYLKQREDRPEHQVSRAFHEAMFGDHVYSRDPLGSLETLGTLSQDDLKEHYQRVYSTEGMIVVCSGRLDLDFLLDRLSDLPNISPRFKDQEVPPRPLEAPARVFMEMDKEQTHIIHGYRGVRITEEDRYGLSLVQAILAGQGGRLFLELRDKNSLAYSVSPLRMEGVDVGYFGAYIACSPEKGMRAIEMMELEFEKLKSLEVSEEELTRAKRYLAGRHDLDMQRARAQANSVLFNVIYGLSPEEDWEFLKKIASVSVQDIRELCERLFSRPSVTAAVGRTRPW